MRLDVGLEGLAEAALASGEREVIDEAGGGGEERLVAVLDGPCRRSPWRGAFCRDRSNGSHNAHDSQTATVYYRWHPLCGETLRIRKRARDRLGERVFCELPDGTVCALPGWMLQPSCERFSFGAPLIAVEALSALRDLLSSLPTSPADAPAALRRSSQEEAHEANTPATPPAAAQAARDGAPQPQTKRTQRRSGRAADPRHAREPEAESPRRGR